MQRIAMILCAVALLSGCCGMGGGGCKPQECGGTAKENCGCERSCHCGKKVTY